MTVAHLVFLVLAAMTLGGALGVVTSRSVFVSALWLVLSFVGVAGMYVLLDAGLLAVIQIIVYVGAISILILFTIMLTRRVMGGEKLSNSQWFLAAIVASAVFGMLSVVAYQGNWPLQSGEVLPASGGTGTIQVGAAAEPATGALRQAQGTMQLEGAESDQVYVPSPVVMLGRALMNDHLLAFEAASVLLLVALMGAVIIARE